MTGNLVYTGYGRTRSEQIEFLVEQIKHVAKDPDQKVDQKEELLSAISTLINISDEEYQDNVDSYYDKFSEYLYQDLELKD
jgi:hypothetical protein